MHHLGWCMEVEHKRKNYLGHFGLPFLLQWKWVCNPFLMERFGKGWIKLVKSEKRENSSLEKEVCVLGYSCKIHS